MSRMRAQSAGRNSLPKTKRNLDRRKLTVELIDRLLDLQAEEHGELADEFMEAIWGRDGEEGVLRDLLILARVALDHINVVIIERGPTEVEALTHNKM